MRNAGLTATIWRLVQSPALIFLIALTIRLTLVAQILPGKAWQYFFERNEASHIAWAAATGHGFSSPWPNTPLLPTAQQPPLYPLLLAGIFKLFGVYSYRSLWIGIVLNASFAALTAVAILRMGKQAFSPFVGILAAWMWSCSLLEAAASVRLWESSLSALLLITALFLLMQLKSSARQARWILFGLLAGLAALNNTSLLAIFPFFWLWLWYSHRCRGNSCNRALLSSIAVCVLVLVPWTVRNYAVFHQFIPIRDNFGLELWVGNRHDTDFSIMNVAEFNQLGEIRFMKTKRDLTLQSIHAHPRQFMQAVAWRSYRYWVAPDGSAWPWISLLAWAGLVLMLRREGFEAVPFAIVLLVFPIIYYLTHSHVTYRYPIEPEILLCAAYAVVTITRFIARPFKVAGAAER
jgi:4-amino-4-deoxy-L-arabinose transferase-like glycosyltransferase